VLLALPLTSLVLRYRTMDLSADSEAYDYGTRLLSQAAPGAVLLSRGDTQTFPLWYVRYGLKQREDVWVVDSNLLAFGWYRAQVAALSPELAAVARAGDSREAVTLLVSILGPLRPVQLAYEDEGLLGAYAWTRDGWLYSLLR